MPLLAEQTYHHANVEMYFESSVIFTDMLKEAYVARVVSPQFCFASEEIYSDPEGRHDGYAWYRPFRMG